MKLATGAHNAEIAMEVSAILATASSVQTADRGNGYVVLDVFPPYDRGDGEQWANERCTLINQIDPRVVTAEVLRAEMSKPRLQ